MSGCFNSDSLETCKHGVHVRLKCGTCETEHKYNLLQSQLESCREKITELERKQEELLEIYKCNWAAQKYCESKKPHICPLCEGNKIKKREKEKELIELCQRKLKECNCKGNCNSCKNIMTIMINECDVCEGKGIIWG